MIMQLRAVALTYLTRRVMWFVAFLVAIYALNVASANPSSLGAVRNSAQFLVGFPAGLMAYLAVSQAKWHFVNPRARVTPRFAAHHLAVLSFVILVGVGLVPVLVAGIVGLNGLGAAACTIAITSSFTWSMHAMRMLPNLVALAAFFSLLAERGVYFWLWPAAAGEFRLIHWGIVIVGWVAEIAWIVRLARMTEEDDDYNIPIQAQSGAATRMERDQANRNMVRYLLRSNFACIPVDLWHDRLHRIGASTARARTGLLRYGFVPTPVLVQAGIMAGVFLVVLSFMYSALETGPGSAPAFSLAALNIMVIMPAMIPANLMPARRARMAQELMLPLTRRQYIDGLFTAIAKQGLATWLVMHLAMLGMIARYAPAMLTLPFIAALTALALSVQFACFGFMVWAARYSSAVARMALMTIIIVPPMLGVVFGLNALQLKPQADPLHPAVYESLGQELPPAERARIQQQIARREQRVLESRRSHPEAAWMVAGALAGVGVVGLVLSHRRWMETELA